MDISKENKCGECTLCCTMFPVKWLDKPAMTDCVHCVLKKGCSIQDTKEDECRDFDCMYVQMKKVPVELRPDNCGIVFEKLSDEIIYGSIDPNNEMSEMGKKQIGAFISQGFSVVMASIKEINNGFFINPAHNEMDIRKDFHNYLTEKF